MTSPWPWRTSSWREPGLRPPGGRGLSGPHLSWSCSWQPRRLWGSATGLLAVALALLGTDVFYWGCFVLGDIPALALFLLGTGFLIQGLESRSNWPLFLGGLFLGLAFDAKEFYGLAFLPPLGLLVRQSWREPRRPGARPPGLWRRSGATPAGLPAPEGHYLGEPDGGGAPFSASEKTPVPRVLHPSDHRPHLSGRSPLSPATPSLLAGQHGGRLGLEERAPCGRSPALGMEFLHLVPGLPHRGMVGTALRPAGPVPGEPFGGPLSPPERRPPHRPIFDPQALGLAAGWPHSDLFDHVLSVPVGLDYFEADSCIRR